MGASRCASLGVEPKTWKTLLCVPVAAISLAQESILGERHSGTATWVLSKPLQRPVFILAKVIAHGLGLLVFWVLLPGVITYFQLSAAGARGVLLGIGYAAALGLSYLNLFFYLTLAVMLATFFNSRGPVLGIAILVTWSGPMQFIGSAMQEYTPWLDLVLPWGLLIHVGHEGPLAGYVALGMPLPTLVPIIAAALWCVLFTAMAIWRFGREEF